LLILQVVDAHEGREAARFVTDVSGPATIVVSGGTARGLDHYFFDLYEKIRRNYALRDVVKPAEYPGAPDVDAFLGEGADRALQFLYWGAHTDALPDIEPMLAEFVPEDFSKLHVSDRRRLQSKIRQRLDTPMFDVEIRSSRNAHDRYPALTRQLREEARALAERAPRVLNANFADPKTRSLASPMYALRQDMIYELLVDVGPRWSRGTSLVKGNDAFPETALPPRDDGWFVDVVFFSDDFTSVETDGEEFPFVDLPPLSDDVTAYAGRFHQPVAKARIWVPARSGRSFAMINGERSPVSGPASMAMRTPVRIGPARGRLSLYCENNLLQSAIVKAEISEGWSAGWNIIEVDYVLSGDFADLGRHATRSLDEKQYPVGISIAMNDDGNGSHRLMVAGHGDLTVSRPYDPKASEKILQTARNKLKECFSVHDSICHVPADENSRKSALDAENGKTLAEFKCDLFQLAWYGSDLFTHAFGQISSPNLVQYLQRLRAALKSRTVIQVARTSHAQYVYPWAMLYDIPLPNRGIQGKLRWCKVVDEEWGRDGRRTIPMADGCPYEDRPEHQQDMLCPYGFWGLKHHVEQPINVVGDGGAKDPALPRSAASTVSFGKPLSFGLGVTRDVSLDAGALQRHIDAIRKLAACTPSDGADDWDEVQLMLAHPDIAYFLCHGEYDTQREAPYIGVGPRGSDAKHRVYPSELLQWATTQQDFWSDRQPLVFINGCHTANLAPGEILSFVSTFANFGASAVIGTEISIRLPLAAEVAEKMLSRILGGEAVGAVMHSLRWELANKGNLLGLAYTPYCLSDLRFASPA
jgi:hypothetical protein